MNSLFVILCSLLTVLYILPHSAAADDLDRAQKARNYPAATEKYNKIVADLEKEREQKRQNELEQQKQATKYDDEGLAKIETALMARNIESARHELKKGSFGWEAKDDVERVIECVNKILEFYTYMNQKKDTQAAIALYAPAIQACNAIPDPIPFSDKLANAINTSLDGAEKFINKECGKDYGQIRVGMSLKQVNKCYGEIFLHGQAKWKGGSVDYYTRGNTYIYAKNGKVVAWGE